MVKAELIHFEGYQLILYTEKPVAFKSEEGKDKEAFISRVLPAAKDHVNSEVEITSELTYESLVIKSLPTLEALKNTSVGNARKLIAKVIEDLKSGTAAPVLKVNTEPETVEEEEDLLGTPETVEEEEDLLGTPETVEEPEPETVEEPKQNPGEVIAKAIDSMQNALVAFSQAFALAAEYLEPAKNGFTQEAQKIVAMTPTVGSYANALKSTEPADGLTSLDIPTEDEEALKAFKGRTIQFKPRGSKDFITGEIKGINVDSRNGGRIFFRIKRHDTGKNATKEVNSTDYNILNETDVLEQAAENFVEDQKK